MTIRRSFFVRAIVVALVASVCSLSVHIWLVHWAENVSSKMVDNWLAKTTTYDWFTICMAYLTSFIHAVFLVFIYFHSSQIFPFNKPLPRALLVTAIVLGIEQELIRQPLMNFVCNLQLGWDTAFLVSLVNQLSVWIPSFLFCTIIVFTIPRKDLTACKKFSHSLSL